MPSNGRICQSRSLSGYIESHTFVLQSMDRLEDYDPEFGVSLCQWLSSLPTENFSQNHTEEVDCDAAPLFEFLRIRVNDKYLYLDSRDYIYRVGTHSCRVCSCHQGVVQRVHPNLKITCHTEFIPYDDPEGGNWIFGTSFLRGPPFATLSLLVVTVSLF